MGAPQEAPAEEARLQLPATATATAAGAVQQVAAAPVDLVPAAAAILVLAAALAALVPAAARPAAAAILVLAAAILVPATPPIPGPVGAARVRARAGTMATRVALVGRPVAARTSRPGRAAAPNPVVAAKRAKPPRLILRFALNTAIALALAGVGVLLVVRHHGTVQAERAVAFHARFVSDSILRDRLQSSDFDGPVDAARQGELDRLFKRQLLIGGTLRLTVFGPDGRVTYSSDPALIGTSPPEGSEAAKAFGGELVRKPAQATINGRDTKVLKAFVPVRLADGGRAGALELDQDYAPIAASAQKAFLPIAAVLEGVLILLYLSLFPALRRVTKMLDRHVSEVEHQALHDALTGLPNRILFRDRVEQALKVAEREGTGVGVMIMDLDRFKEVNDTLGHAVGDLLLQEFATRVQGALRDGDTVARLGGDEFAVIAPGPRDPATALHIAERIRRRMEQPFEHGQLTLQIEASIGIALSPDDGEDVETLLRHADVAMYVSKRTHAPTLYAPKYDENSPARLALVGELSRALERDELVLHYQPEVELGNGAVPRVEALIRWNHPKRGLLAPDDFIPVAQHTGLIRPLTRFVLESALTQCRAWRDEGLELGVAINLSGRDLLDLGLVDEIVQALARHDLEPSSLELEIPESTIFADTTRVRRVLSRLSECGVRLAIDDFGTGHSSLSFVKELPVDVIKVDRSFVSGLVANEGDTAIVRSTVELAHDLGLIVVAEGVETPEVLDRLVEFGCDLVQGFHLHKPAPADELTPWLRHLRPGKKHLRLAG
ncbi:MAG: EAL domain-containing protein [Gaiellaceae bacterium]